MSLNEQDVGKLQQLHFYWDEKNKEFYRDWNCPGNSYMTLRFDGFDKKWILYEFTEDGYEDEGWREDWENFSDLNSLFKYFGL